MIIDLEEVRRFMIEAMKDKLRKDGTTPLSSHSIHVEQFLHQCLGIDDVEARAAALLHDLREDVGTPSSVLEVRFGARVRRYVEEQTYVYISEEAHPLKEDRRQMRYADMEARVSFWDLTNCLIKIADILCNLVWRDGLPANDHYRTWTLRRMLQALELRLLALGWRGPNYLDFIHPDGTPKSEAWPREVVEQFGRR